MRKRNEISNEELWRASGMEAGRKRGLEKFGEHFRRPLCWKMCTKMGPAEKLSISSKLARQQ